MKKRILKFSQNKNIILIFLFICFLLYSFIAITLHDHFLTFGWDLGYFDQLIWKISNGLYPYSTLSKVNLLAGHFAPILFLFAPLYWIWSDPRMLLIVQVMLMVSAAWPLYLLTIQKTHSKIFSFGVVFSYLFFLGTQWSILSEFHEATIVPLFLSLIFYSLEKEKKIYFWIGIIGLLFTKEEMALLVVAIGLTVFFYFKEKKLGFIISLASIIFFFFLTNIFMPAISEKGTYQHSHLSSTARTPSELIIEVLSNPLFALRSIVTPPEKVNTFVISFLSFGFLPIFAPIAVLFPLMEQFLMRFLYTGPQFTVWQNVNHHTAPSAMLLALSSVYAASILANNFFKNKNKIFTVLALLLFIATISQDVLLKAPIHSLLKRQFYETLPWMEDNRAILNEAEKILPNVPLAAQNSMFPHLSQREKIYLLPEINDAQYLVIDLHDGPNKYAPLQYDQMKEFIDKLILSGEYSIYKQQGEALILVRSGR